MIAARCSPTGWRSAVQLDKRETDTVIAALRFWQRCIDPRDPEVEIARDGDDEVIPLGDTEIDALIERLNQ